MFWHFIYGSPFFKCVVSVLTLPVRGGGVNVCQDGLWNIVHSALLSERSHGLTRMLQENSRSLWKSKLQVVNKMKTMKSGEL